MIYQYKCRYCGFEFKEYCEVELRDKQVCPNCSSGDLYRYPGSGNYLKSFRGSTRGSDE